jgi:hypothetical protein
MKVTTKNLNIAERRLNFSERDPERRWTLVLQGDFDLLEHIHTRTQASSLERIQLTHIESTLKVFKEFVRRYPEEVLNSNEKIYRKTNQLLANKLEELLPRTMLMTYQWQDVIEVLDALRGIDTKEKAVATNRSRKNPLKRAEDILRLYGRNAMNRHNEGFTRLLGRVQQELRRIEALLAGRNDRARRPAAARSWMNWRRIMGFGANEAVDFAGVRRRYKQLALVHHPNKGGDPEEFKQLGTAFAAAKAHFGAV